MGSDTLTAAYTPTGLYAAATSAPQTLAVTPPLSASLTPATLQAGHGTAGTPIVSTLTVNVAD